MYFTFYDTTSGEITKTLDVEDTATADLNLVTGEAYITGDYDHDTHYVVSGTATPRPASPVVFPVTNLAQNITTTITGVENPSSVTLSDDIFIIAEDPAVTTGTIDFVSAAKGNYTFEITAFPSLDVYQVITVA